MSLFLGCLDSVRDRHLGRHHRHRFLFGAAAPGSTSATETAFISRPTVSSMERAFIPRRAATSAPPTPLRILTIRRSSVAVGSRRRCCRRWPVTWPSSFLLVRPLAQCSPGRPARAGRRPRPWRFSRFRRAAHLFHALERANARVHRARGGVPAGGPGGCDGGKGDRRRLPERPGGCSAQRMPSLFRLRDPGGGGALDFAALEADALAAAAAAGAAERDAARGLRRLLLYVGVSLAFLLIPELNPAAQLGALVAYLAGQRKDRYTAAPSDIAFRLPECAREMFSLAGFLNDCFPSASRRGSTICRWPWSSCLPSSPPDAAIRPGGPSWTLVAAILGIQAYYLGYTIVWEYHYTTLLPTIPVLWWLYQAEKGAGPIRAKHREGRSGKLDLSPFLRCAIAAPRHRPSGRVRASSCRRSISSSRPTPSRTDARETCSGSSHRGGVRVAGWLTGHGCRERKETGTLGERWDWRGLDRHSAFKRCP